MAAVQKPVFNLAAATLMVAPFGTDPWSLVPSLHSVGMVREVSVAQAASVIELRNGVAQGLVDSKKSGAAVTITAKVFEFSAANLLRSLSLTRSAIPGKFGKLSAAVAGAAASVSVSIGTGTGITGDSTTDIIAITDIPAGATIMLQRTGGAYNDYVFPTKTTGVPTLVGSVMTIPIAAPYAVPAGLTFAAGDNFWLTDSIPTGDLGDLGFFSVKIAAVASNFERPVVNVFPKVKITKGFGLDFKEGEYDSMAWELQPFLLAVSEQTGRLADFGSNRVGDTHLAA